LQINSKTRIKLNKFFFRKENNYFMVWPESKTNFIELTPESFEALNLLKKDLTISEIEKILENKFGEPVNLKEFVLELIDLGFVKYVNHIKIKNNKKRKTTLSSIKKSHVSWIYSKPMLYFYIFLVSVALLILFFNPSYFPSYTDFFFTENYLFTLIISIITALTLILIHEFAHLIAGKAVGVDGNISIGMRLFYPVAETNLTGLWSLPKKQRLIPLLAGMLNDILIISIILIAFRLSDFGLLPKNTGLFNFGKFIILILSYGIIWQFLFFIRTDIYFVVVTLSGAKNLYGDAWQFISNQISIFFGKTPVSLQLSNKELRIVKGYSIFMLSGTIISMLSFIYFGIPILYEILMQSINLIKLNDTASFIEGSILFIIASIQIIGVLYFIIQSTRKAKKD